MMSDENPVTYPFPDEAKLKNYGNGNFGLWFNKFTPLTSSEDKGKSSPIDYCKKFYDDKIRNKGLIKKFLNGKHYSQYRFYKSFEKKYDIIVIAAELVSPLITGIGLTHPNEVGMAFDHTLGIPYIPASTIKGIVRFSHILDLCENNPNIIKDKIKKDKNGELYFDEEEEWTNVVEMFGSGGDKRAKVGRVIFLDAYPETIPEIVVDIMNPHYGEYYSDSSGRSYPADYLKLVPIKFLTVAKNTKFIFRILVSKTYDESKDNKSLIFNAIEKSLEKEGVGAKTAVGYGLFVIKNLDESESVTDLIDRENRMKEEENLNNMTEVDQICYKLENKYDEKYSMDICREITSNDEHCKEDKFKIAEALRRVWKKHGKWSKKQSKKQSDKIKKIKDILNNN